MSASGSSWRGYLTLTEQRYKQKAESKKCVDAGDDCPELFALYILPSIAKHNTLCFAGCAAAAKAT